MPNDNQEFLNQMQEIANSLDDSALYSGQQVKKMFNIIFEYEKGILIQHDRIVDLLRFIYKTCPKEVAHD